MRSNASRAQQGLKLAGVWLRPDEKQRLEALALLSGRTQSDVLRDLIAAAPLEPGKPNGAAGTADAFEFRRDECGAQTTVPCRVRHHSPTGFEWGYGGSGPADLALNICEDVLLGLGYKGERMKCFDGECFEVAMLAHQELKEAFVAGLPHEGGRIERQAVEAWLLNWMVNCG